MVRTKNEKNKPVVNECARPTQIIALCPTPLCRLADSTSTYEACSCPRRGLGVNVESEGSRSGNLGFGMTEKHIDERVCYSFSLYRPKFSAKKCRCADHECSFTKPSMLPPINGPPSLSLPRGPYRTFSSVSLCLKLNDNSSSGSTNVTAYVPLALNLVPIYQLSPKTACQWFFISWLLYPLYIPSVISVIFSESPSQDS